MTIDPLTSLAFAVHSQPGVYAVLVGSGASRAADIPTGWGITNDLLRQLAQIESESIPSDPPDWYEARFGEPVGFSALLRRTATRASERQALLARYIEPQDGKQHRRPTPAHRALAELAASRHIRVFLTTNFDRLLEQALADEGVQPLVISTPAAARGAPPFHHSDVVVFKLHGDYRDPDSMLVTDDELEKYHRDVSRLLGRTLEDYGLVVCGWSGTWDPALRAAISASRARRYPFYAAVRGTTSTELQEIITARDGVAIPIEDADGFFTSLRDRVLAIKRANEPHPLDVAALVEGLKRLIASRAHTLEIHDVVRAETERAIVSLADEFLFPREIAEEGTAWPFLVGQVHRYLGSIEGLVRIFAVGGAWADPKDAGVWEQSIARVANQRVAPGGGNALLLELRGLPLLVLLYSGAVAATTRHNYQLLRAITTDATVNRDYDRVPLVGVSHPWRVLSHKMLANVLAMAEEAAEADEVVQRLKSRGEWRHTPHSDFLHRILREALRELVPDDTEYDEVFDEAEILLAAIAADTKLQSEAGHLPYVYGPWYGRFTWRMQYSNQRPEERLAEEAAAAGETWPPLQAGLFGADSERARAALALLLEEAAQARGGRW